MNENATIVIPKKLRDRLKVESIKERTSMQSLIAKILTDHLKKK